jgi:Glycosyl hydrolases family 38 N-terminal domain/Glycosyl hydrolases family 38 C-terminal domain
MPRKRPAVEDVRTRKAREEMIQGPSAVDLDVHDFSVRAGGLPLFRRKENGSLSQALRLVVRAESVAGDVAFTVSDGDAVLDTAKAWIEEGRTLVYLFVPEVSEPRALTLRVEAGRSEPFEAGVEVCPQRKWSVFLVHHSHLDIGYTDTQSSVLQHHLQYLDSVLDLASATDDWPEDAKFRWNVEANWPLLHWIKNRPESDRNRFFDRVREGRIEICALPFSMHTEAYSIDELARQLRFADELRGQFDAPIETAMQTDVPGATIGLLTSLVDADIRYLSVAHNYAGRSAPHLVGGQELTRPFYWRAPNGKRLLVWYTDSPHGSAYMEGNLVGLAEGYQATLEALPGYLSALAESPYPYRGRGESVSGWTGLDPSSRVTKEPYPHDVLHLRVQGVLADNASPSIVPAGIVREWNEKWAYPQLRLATNSEFFTEAEEKLAEAIETYSGDWTDWWVDGIGSGARHLGFNRRAQADVRTAQTLHTLADTLTEDGADPQDEIDETYESMALFDEHTWGAANPWMDGLERRESGALQWETKAGFARDAYERSNALVRSGVHRLSHAFGRSGDSPASVTVFNPSRWERTDPVSVFVPESRSALQRPLAVVDCATRERVPCVVEDQENAQFRVRGSRLSFVARDVPAFGYRRYDLAQGEEEHEGPEAGDEPCIENEYYRVRFDLARGMVTELLDKTSGLNLVDTDAPFGFNQYVYDRYASAPHFNHLSSRIQATDLALLGERSAAGLAVVTQRSSNPVWDGVTVRLVDERADIVESTLTLFRGVRRLDITNRIHKVGTPEKESVYFAFPFDVRDPSLHYEITGGIDSPDVPHVPGSADHMRAIRHWVGLENEKIRLAWATMEAPLVQFGNIHLPYLPFPETIDPEIAKPATVYSWALNNIWDTNFPSRQQGEMEFGYAVASGEDVETPELGMRTAAALTTPLLGILSAPSAENDLPERGSFCSVEHPRVDVVALIPSKRGHDLTVMLQSMSSAYEEICVSFGLLSVARAWVGTHLEKHLEEARVEGENVRFVVPAGSLVSLVVDLEHGR